MKNRVIICGSRHFSDRELCFKTLDAFLLGKKDVEIISGHGKGADTFAEEYAAEKGIELKVFHPEWKLYGKGAGPMRNRRMLAYAEEGVPFVVAFWDGKSKGTGNMIEISKKHGVDVLVVRVPIMRDS